MVKYKSTDIPKLLLEVIPPLVHLLRAELKRAAPPKSLSFPQFRVLANIFRGLNTVSEIAEIVGVSQPAMTKMVNGLEKSELVMRELDELDRRKHYLKLTDKGEKLYHSILLKAHSGIDQHFSSLKATDKKTLIRALKDLQALGL